MHGRVTKEIFSRGLNSSRILSSEYLSDSGLSIDQALKTLSLPAGETEACIEGSVLEAHAAAAAHASAAQLDSPFVVYDIGAGTTDLARFKLSTNNSGQLEMNETSGARLSFALAGNELDAIIMNAFLRKAPLSNKLTEQKAFWRKVSQSISDLTREVFSADRCVVLFDGKIISLNRREIENDPRFKAFLKPINTRLDRSLSSVAAAAHAQKVKAISLILAGGCSGLPFFVSMAKTTERTRRKHARVKFEPLAPPWINTPEFEENARVFPQLEIAIGGASPLVKVTNLGGCIASIAAVNRRLQPAQRSVLKKRLCVL